MTIKLSGLHYLTVRTGVTQLNHSDFTLPVLQLKLLGLLPSPRTEFTPLYKPSYDRVILLWCTRQVFPMLANAQRKHHSCRPPKRKAGFFHRTEARRDLSPDCQVPPSERFCQRDMSYLGNTDELASSWGAQALLGSWCWCPWQTSPQMQDWVSSSATPLGFYGQLKYICTNCGWHRHGDHTQQSPSRWAVF